MTTSISRRTILAGGLATAAALSLAACGKASESSGSSDAGAAAWIAELERNVPEA